MMYARARKGGPWHPVVTGADHTVCGIEAKYLVEIAGAPGIEQCENCDNLLRSRGRELMKARRLRARRRRHSTVYRPRFRYGDWENGEGQR